MKKKTGRSRKEQRITQEQFRQLKASLEFSRNSQSLQILNIVSSFPGEGKSTISAGLAETFADSRGKVLLIDCDLRNPSLHKMFRISSASGLTDLLSHYRPGTFLEAAPELVKIEKKSSRPFWLLSAGAPVSNPMEFFSSRVFADFLETARTQFSTILLDCPPCLAVSDAIPLSHLSDGTIYVISAEDTNEEDVREGLHLLRRNGANILGAVLTKAEPGKMHSRYSYYYD